MKHIRVLSLLLFIGILPCTAQLKVVQKSAKKTPVWVNTTQKDYIVTSAIADNIERAKNECMDNIRKYVIDAVAQNVKSSSESTINQESVNSGIVNFLDSYTYTAQTQSANLPYLTGISESKTEEAYWEKREDKKTKEISYLYCVKYPFPSLELKKLVHEFQRKDNEMNEKYKTLEEQYENIASVAQIDKAITDLNSLIRYFFDDVRKEAARNLQRNYRQLYGEISIHEISNKLGCYRLDLQLRGKAINVSQRPVVKSATLTQIRPEAEGDQWNIHYNSETCDPTEENFATITFKLGNKNLSQTFYIDPEQDKVKVTLSKDVYLTAETKTDSLIANITIRLNLESEENYIIDNITLNVPGLSLPLFIDNLNQAVSKGTQTVNISYNGEVELVEKQNNRMNLLKGHLEIKNTEGVSKRIDFSLPFKANW